MPIYYGCPCSTWPGTRDALALLFLRSLCRKHANKIEVLNMSQFNLFKTSSSLPANPLSYAESPCKAGIIISPDPSRLYFIHGISTHSFTSCMLPSWFIIILLSWPRWHYEMLRFWENNSLISLLCILKDKL